MMAKHRGFQIIFMILDLAFFTAVFAGGYLHTVADFIVAIAVFVFAPLALVNLLS